MKLNLGCGYDVKDGWINVDIDDDTPADGIMDLEHVPWPWDDDEATRILMDNVFEHLRPRARPEVLDECARVLHSNGVLEMAIPVPEVGVGWDVSHQSIPSWRWPLHPERESTWELISVRGSRVGPGKVMTEPLARFVTRFWIARCVDEVTIRVRRR